MTGREAAELFASEPRWIAMAVNWCRDLHNAEEALQRASLITLTKLPAEITETEARAWFCTVLKNECRGVYRREKRRAHDSLGFAGDQMSAVDPPSPLPGPEEQAELSDDLSMLDRLKPDEKRALFLFGLGESYKDIGSQNGWTYTKVNRCIREGRAKIRELAAA